MSTVFKPRRSSKGRMDQTGTTGKYANAVLGAGELFLERQQTGTTYTEGSGSTSSPVQYRMKIGDGTTKYSSLGYADQTPVSTSGSAGDGNLVGNVAQDTSNGGITATFQSLADKKVNSVTSNSSTTVANALNTVAANNTLKDILGALKQAVSLCNTAITSLNDDRVKVLHGYIDDHSPGGGTILRVYYYKINDLLICYGSGYWHSFSRDKIYFPTSYQTKPIVLAQYSHIFIEREISTAEDMVFVMLDFDLCVTPDDTYTGYFITGNRNDFYSNPENGDIVFIAIGE